MRRDARTAHIAQLQQRTISAGGRCAIILGQHRHRAHRAACIARHRCSHRCTVAAIPNHHLRRGRRRCGRPQAIRGHVGGMIVHNAGRRSGIIGAAEADVRMVRREGRNGQWRCMRILRASVRQWRVVHRCGVVMLLLLVLLIIIMMMMQQR